MRTSASCQCTDYVRVSYAGANEARVERVTFAVGEAVWCLPRWPRHTVVPDLHLHHPGTPSSTINYMSWAYQTVWCTYDLYLWAYV